MTGYSNHRPTRATRRPGMSMAEVLVALFVMALGAIAILTMFPVGMFQMGQALKDDRTSQAAAAADGYMRHYWRTEVVEKGGGTEPFVAALDNPDARPDSLNAAPNPTKGTQSVAGLPTTSYPVFVDPMGYVAPWGSQNTTAHQFWVGNQLIPRRSLNQVMAQGGNYPQRVCSLLDGFSYGTDGQPANTTGVIERELRYNWLWVIQRPNNADKYTANMTVVVFDKRAFQFAPANAEQVFAGSPTPTPIGVPNPQVVFVVGATSIQVPTALRVPAVQKGGWVMDGTVSGITRHALFYRVVSVTDNPGNPALGIQPTTDLELQTPIRRADGKSGPGIDAYSGTLIVPAGVSEVFERPVLTARDF